MIKYSMPCYIAIMPINDAIFAIGLTNKVPNNLYSEYIRTHILLRLCTSD